MVAPVELPAHLPLVIGAHSPGRKRLTVALAVVRMMFDPPNVCGAPLETLVNWSNRPAVVRLPVLGSSSRS